MKRKLSLFLIFLAIAVLFCACVKKVPEETAPRTETATDDKASTMPREIPEAEDLLGLCPSWAYRGSEGFLQHPGDYAEKTIHSKADLAPYRKFFPDLSDADVERITSDGDGTCLLVEMTPSFDLSDFTTAGIDREAGNIIITILETESETPAPAHTCFLFYFPSSLYRGETVRVLFS